MLEQLVHLSVCPSVNHLLWTLKLTYFFQISYMHYEERSPLILINRPDETSSALFKLCRFSKFEGSIFQITSSSPPKVDCFKLFSFRKIFRSFLPYADFFSKSTFQLFQKKSFRNTIRVSSSLDPNRANILLGLI